MADNLWKKIDYQHGGDRPRQLEPTDHCYYAREYISAGGYQASEANQLIANFKKSPDRRGKPEYTYKYTAANQFARELAQVLPPKYCVVAIPTSKPRGHAEYCERFDLMLQDLRQIRPDLQIEEPIVRVQACQSSHTGGARDPNEVQRTCRWRGFAQTPSVVALVDDMITSGSIFKGCQEPIKRTHPEVTIVGLFWTRAVRLY